VVGEGGGTNERGSIYLKTSLQREMEFSRQQLDDILCGITDGQFLWTPPGTENPISAVLIHVLAAEDDIIRPVNQRKPPCWEEQQRDRKIWIKIPPAPGRGWEEVKMTRLEIRPIREYGRIVRKATDDYLRTVTVRGLNRKVVFYGMAIPVSEVLITLINQQHPACRGNRRHAGNPGRERPAPIGRGAR
jgi:hypothetical protein